MKKILLFILFIILAICGFSQKYLTNRQVYNFNVGDVFETEANLLSASYSPAYYLDSISAKWFSASLDTVYYVKVEYSHRASCGLPCKGFSLGPIIDTFFVTRLDSACGFDTSGKYCPSTRIVYKDTSGQYCGRRVDKVFPTQTCFADTLQDSVANLAISWSIEGCGGVYFYEYNTNGIPTNGNYKYLIYYKRHDTVCGNYVAVGVNELNSDVKGFTIYPNPASTSITLSYQLNSNNAILKLYNTMGQLLESKTINKNNGTIEDNVSALSGGVYYYTLSVDGVVEATSKLVVIR
jgi:hypothetical protein